MNESQFYKYCKTTGSTKYKLVLAIFEYKSKS